MRLRPSLAAGIIIVAAATAVLVWRAHRRASPATAAAAIAIHPQEIHQDADDSVMMVVPALTFTMGTAEVRADLPASRPVPGRLRPPDVLIARAYDAWAVEDERPAHLVTLRAFAIDRYEVTNAQYRRFLADVAKHGDAACAHPVQPKGKDHTPRYWGDFNPLLHDPAYARLAQFNTTTFTADAKPVVGVDWYDAYAYAKWAGKRLPTEAEWELAARGTDGRLWPWGNDWAWGRCNIVGENLGADVRAKGREKDGYIYPAPVGTYPDGRSPFGCDDMAGNAAEWCADWYAADDYQVDAPANPQGPAEGTERAVRGGSSQNFPSNVRCAVRFHHEPEFRSFTLGFRCAKDY